MTNHVDMSNMSMSDIYTFDNDNGNQMSYNSTSNEQLESGESWWERNNDWIVGGLGVIGGLALALTGNPIAGTALMTAGAGYYANEQNNTYKKEQYEREVQDQKDAEARANAEYDRRVEDSQEYNEAWQLRAQQQGINPLALINSGSANSNYTASAPSTTSMPRGAGYARTAYNPSQSIVSAQEYAVIENQLANAEFTRAQTQRTMVDAKTAWIQQCITRFEAGDYDDANYIDLSDSLSPSAKLRYDVVVDDAGNVSIAGMPKHEDANTRYSLSDYSEAFSAMKKGYYSYSHETFGEFKILEGGYLEKRVKGYADGLMLQNDATREDVASVYVNLYCQVLQAMASGSMADASLIQAFASQLAANFNYGDEFNAKWIIQYVTDSVLRGADIVGTFKSMANDMKKFKTPTKTSTHTYTSASGTDTYSTISH